MTTTFGWDMSHYDAPSLGSAVSEGIEFVTHKAGGDSASGDAELDDWWSGVRGLRSRILVGAYWVLLPGSPITRADAFLATLDKRCPSWRDTDFFLFADCERWRNDPKTVPSITEVNAFCDRLRDKVPKLKPMGYLPQWVYGDKVSAFRYPIIESNYVAGTGGFRALYPGDNSVRWGIGGGKTATILQYSSHATIGGQPTSDANAFKGDLLALRKLVAPGFYSISNPARTESMTREESKQLAKDIVDEFLGRDLGHPGGGDTVGVAFQTGILGNGKAILETLQRIEEALTAPDVPRPQANRENENDIHQS